MLEPPIDISSGKSSSRSDSNIDEVEFNARLGLKTVTISPVFIRPIQVIHIQTFSPQELATNQACSASEQNNFIYSR